MPVLRELPIPGFETVVEATDPAIGYHAFVAIHSTRLGPAVGGTRFLGYPSAAAGLADALRLAEGMTYKAALAGIGMGGGKAVLLQPTGLADRATLYRAHGQVVEALGGRYITAGDVGTSVDDLEVIATQTRHVGGRIGGMGDTGPYTADGVLQAIRAVAEVVLHRPDLGGVRVAVQGAGKVGADLCRRLAEAGAQVLVADPDRERAAAAAGPNGTVVAVDEAHRVEADIFSPCALGGILDEASVGQLRARAVVGAANNQLAAPEVDRQLADRGVCYVPDFLANAGGILSGCADLLGYPREDCLRRIAGIYDTTTRVLQESAAHGETPLQSALRMARANLAAAGA